MLRAVFLGLCVLGLRGQDTLRIPSGQGGLQLFLRHQPSKRPQAPPVLILHGATFPSGNAAAWAMDGRSWMQELADAGFDVWALDFLGYGGSERYPEMARDDAKGAPLGSVDEMAEQVARAVARIQQGNPGARAHLVAHSAGTFVAGRFAQLHPESVDRLVLFGAPAPSEGPQPGAASGIAHFQMSAQDELDGFEARVRAAERLDLEMFQAWNRAYLATDAASASRTPASVRVPSGLLAASQEVDRSGRLPYDPAALLCPTLLIQGEWDEVTRPEQGLWLFHRLGAPLKRFVLLSRGGHRLHLEASRRQLYREVEAFLKGGDQ